MTTPVVYALSRAEVEGSECAAPCIIISIRSPGQRTAIVGSNEPLDVLFLEFNDVDKDGVVWTIDGSPPGKPKLFSKEQAKQVVDFVNEWKDKVDVIICQCEAGISRSSGTAAAVCALLGQHREDGDFWLGRNTFGMHRYHPNVHVYKMILKAAGMVHFKGNDDVSENH